MGMFLAGFVTGVLCIAGFIVFNAIRPERMIPLLVHAFQVVRLHLGRNSIVAGVTGPHGWRIEIHCFGCGQITSATIKELPKHATGFACGACGKPFKETGNDHGGTGVNAMRVEAQ